MWSKRNRLAVCTSIAQEVFWLEQESQNATKVHQRHEDFDPSDLEELLSGDKELQPVDQELVAQAVAYFKAQGVDYVRAPFVSYIEHWEKTYETVRAILYTWIVESDITRVPRSELIGKYLQLTQDLVGGGNTGLVHALLSKVSGTYTPESNLE